MRNVLPFPSITWVPPTLPADTDEKYAEGLKSNVASLVRIHDEAKGRASVIRDSRELTAEGKKNQLGVLGVAMDALLRTATKDVYDRNIAAAEREMTPSKQAPDERTARRQNLVLSHLLTKTMDERDACYIEASLEGKPEHQEFLAAVDSAPWPLSQEIVRPEIRQQYQDQRLAATFPDAYTRRELFSTLRGSLRDAEQLVRMSLREAGVETRAAEPVEEAAEV